jgi:hypothetical protein
MISRCDTSGASKRLAGTLVSAMKPGGGSLVFLVAGGIERSQSGHLYP